jgi:hypothetical protein
MSLNPLVQGRSGKRSFDEFMNVLVVQIFGGLWLRFWLAAYPGSRSVVVWSLHDELSSTTGAARWRRAIAFFAHLPRFASAQSEAESTPATETGGEPPEGPPPRAGSAGPQGAMRQFGFALTLAAVTIIALVTWLTGISALIDLVDTHAVTGDATGVIAVGLLFGVVPMALVYNRRWFAWTPSARAGSDEPLRLRAGWWLATAAFGLLAIVLFLVVWGELLDAFDTTFVVDGSGSLNFVAPQGVVQSVVHGAGLSFTSALGLVALVAIGSGPLAWVIRQRYWLGRTAIVRA